MFAWLEAELGLGLLLREPMFQMVPYSLSQCFILYWFCPRTQIQPCCLSCYSIFIRIAKNNNQNAIWITIYIAILIGNVTIVWQGNNMPTSFIVNYVLPIFLMKHFYKLWNHKINQNIAAISSVLKMMWLKTCSEVKCINIWISTHFISGLTHQSSEFSILS